MSSSQALLTKKIILANLFIAILINISFASVLFYSPSKADLSLMEEAGDNEIIDNQGTVNFLAVGDIMLARKVGTLMKANGLDYPFLKLSKTIQSADIAFGNLESPISSNGKPLPNKGICFRAEPNTAFALDKAGFDVLSLANNHALDYDGEALLDTISLLDQNDIKTVGAGKNITEALEPVIIDKNGVKVGFLAFSDMADIFYDWNYRRIFRATENQSGVAPMEEKIMLREVEKLRDKVDIVVVSIHWGVEYSHQPEEEQRVLAKKIIDSGADLIIGHHPHVLQGIENYKHGLIAYSLGNFIFDQKGEAKNRALIIQAKFSRIGIEKFEVIPITIVNSQVRFAEEHLKEQMLKQINELSQLLDTKFQKNDSLSGLEYVLTGI